MRDHWHLDHLFERLRVDTVVAPAPDVVRWLNPKLVPNEKREVVIGKPGKTSVVYTLDRGTREFLWATPTISQNVVFGIDGATGAVSENEDFVFTAMGEMHLICPSTIGGTNWEAGAYSPLANAMLRPAAQCLHADDGDGLALRFPGAVRSRRGLHARVGEGSAGGDLRRLGGDGEDLVGARAVGVHLVAGGDGGRSCVRR